MTDKVHEIENVASTAHDKFEDEIRTMKLVVNNALTPQIDQIMRGVKLMQQQTSDLHQRLHKYESSSSPTTHTLMHTLSRRWQLLVSHSLLILTMRIFVSGLATQAEDIHQWCL